MAKAFEKKEEDLLQAARMKQFSGRLEETKRRARRACKNLLS